MISLRDEVTSTIWAKSRFIELHYQQSLLESLIGNRIASANIQRVPQGIMLYNQVSALVRGIDLILISDFSTIVKITEQFHLSFRVEQKEYFTSPLNYVSVERYGKQALAICDYPFDKENLVRIAELANFDVTLMGDVRKIKGLHKIDLETILTLRCQIRRPVA